jgi:glycogen debranching enzyme
MRGYGPTFYPVASSPQAWAAGSVLSLLQTCLGLGFDHDDGYVVLDTPILPDFLDSVTLRNVSLPAGRLDVALSRRDAEVAAHVIARRGAAGILVRA